MHHATYEDPFHGWRSEPSGPISQAEDSTQPSGLENRMSGTARPRVRIREHRPGFHP